MGSFSGKPIYQNQIDDFEAGLKEALENLDNLLKGKDYLANNTVTIADMLLFFEMTSLILMGKDVSQILYLCGSEGVIKMSVD